MSLFLCKNGFSMLSNSRSLLPVLSLFHSQQHNPPDRRNLILLIRTKDLCFMISALSFFRLICEWVKRRFSLKLTSIYVKIQTIGKIFAEFCWEFRKITKNKNFFTLTIFFMFWRFTVVSLINRNFNDIFFRRWNFPVFSKLPTFKFCDLLLIWKFVWCF